MALLALLFAHHVAPGCAEPLAAQDAAGLSVLERQVALVEQLGAERTLVLAERMPPALVAALERLGPRVAVLRDAGEAAERIGDDDLVMTIEEGLLPDEAAAAAFFADAARPRLAVTVGHQAHPAAERLDSQSFWAGLAIHDGAAVRSVASGIGEWDLQSTLLRTAAAAAVERIELAEGDWRFAADAAAAASIAARFLDEARVRRFGWPSRLLFARAEPAVVRWLLPRRVQGRWLSLAALSLAALAIALFAAGWLWPALLLALVTPPVADLGVQLSRLRLERPVGWIDDVFDYAVEPGWYVGFGAALAAGGFASAWALAGGAVAFRLAMVRQSRFYRRERPRELEADAPRWAALAASRETAPWLLLAFGLAGAWPPALVALALYATASFFLLQARLFAQLAQPAGPSL